MVHAKSYKILCLWFLSFRSRHKEKWTDLLVLRLAALGRQEFYATSYIQFCSGGFLPWHPFFRFTEKRRNKRKSSPKEGENSPKSGDDRIGHLSFLPTSSRGRSGFNRLPCSKSGRSERGLSSQFWVFFKCLAPYGADSFFQRYRRHTQKSELILRYKEEY